MFATSIGLVGAVMGEMQLRIRRLNRQLREMSLVDPLTGLHNRRFASEVVSSAAQVFVIKKTHPEVKQRRSHLETRVMGIFLVDIDHFKRINDEFGHTTGDRVLVKVAKALESCVRFDDVIVRWGGEEFLVVLSDTDHDYLPRFAAKLLRTVQEQQVETGPGKKVAVTVSAGYLPFPLFGAQGGPTFEESVNLADYALYQAKADGRNRAICFAAPEELCYEELLAAVRRRWPEARPSQRQPRASVWPSKAGPSRAPMAPDLAAARPGH
jgi:diguanylate cyclase (GGDEF)-like protein